MDSSAPSILPSGFDSQAYHLHFYCLQSNLCCICPCIVKRTKRTKKRPGLAHFYGKNLFSIPKFWENIDLLPQKCFITLTDHRWATDISIQNYTGDDVMRARFKKLFDPPPLPVVQILGTNATSDNLRLIKYRARYSKFNNGFILACFDVQGLLTF